MPPDANRPAGYQIISSREVKPGYVATETFLRLTQQPVPKYKGLCNCLSNSATAFQILQLPFKFCNCLSIIPID